MASNRLVVGAGTTQQLRPAHTPLPATTCLLCCCSYMDQTGVSEEGRFVLELEFIQCLANPHYLNCELQRASATLNSNCTK